MNPAFNVIDPSEIDLAEYMKAEDLHAKVIPAWAYADAVIDYFYGESANEGVLLPWQKTHSDFRLRPGEVTIWAGVNGHGKSLLLNQIMLQAMAFDEKVCIASMEMKPKQTMARMTRQAAGGEPTIDFIRKFHEWTENRLWLYDQQGVVQADKMMAVIRYCDRGLAYKGKRARITHFVIDSLMKLGIGVDDYNKQKGVVDQLCAHARDTGMHIHLVAHARKGESERKIQDKFDIKGTSEITDQVDNVFTVWRNKKKEDEAQKQTPDPDAMKEPDALLICSKQRHGTGWEGKVSLWFDKRSHQYVARERDCPQSFFDYEPVPL